ncbi:HPP family protein [Sulfuritortus calidifontis]|uniref:HPP family protein n=1 Tax=Sulfuritortus calidifontis TaxID=1914471 RepID=UPI000F819C70|nr:HPP family protein [Sulfuritortus calidifontis]
MGIRTRWKRWFGDDPHPVSHGEKLLSALGAFFGILGLLVISNNVLDIQGTALVVTSMGASAVLVFAAPHSPLSQPWPVLGGHLLSSTVGIVCAMLIDDMLTAAAVAVALSIAVMFYTRCLHPPGGAAALATVVGGESVRALGFAYLVTPVLLNVLVLLSVAMMFNAPFLHRRYPRWLAELGAANAASQATAEAAPTEAEEKLVIAHSDLVYALSQIDSYVDISEEDLLRIYQLATQHAQVDGDKMPQAA